jgi:molybdopterin-guanine dinucleotide biosynthesis protein MobB
LKPACISIIGWSESGKTTLISRLLPELVAQGLRVAAVKHSGHEHALLKPGSDTERLATAGASWVALATPAGLEIFLSGDPTDQLNRVLESLGGQIDLVVIEGWKDGPFPKIEVWREGGEPLLSQSRPDVLALVTDDRPTSNLPRFGTQDARQLAHFLINWLRSFPSPPERGLG